jgi:PD-(D/E)XK nuclease superfamily
MQLLSRQRTGVSAQSCELTMTGQIDDLSPALRELLSALSDQLPLIEAQVAGVELYGAPRLSAFQLLTPNENQLSRVLADLFDCRGSHGQGALFLNSLLEQIGLQPVGIRDHDRVRVNREVWTDRNLVSGGDSLIAKDGRLDIVIETPNMVLGIENKPWAKQQKHQLFRYWEWLKEEGRKNRQQPKLVFLSDQDPETAHDQVIRVPYRRPVESTICLYEILASSLKSIRAERTRRFIESFMDYIDHQVRDLWRMNGVSNSAERRWESTSAEVAIGEHLPWFFCQRKASISAF